MTYSAGKTLVLLHRGPQLHPVEPVLQLRHRPWLDEHSGKGMLTNGLRLLWFGLSRDSMAIISLRTFQFLSRFTAVRGERDRVSIGSILSARMSPDYNIVMRGAVLYSQAIWIFHFLWYSSRETLFSFGLTEWSCFVCEGDKEGTGIKGMDVGDGWNPKLWYDFFAVGYLCTSVCQLCLLWICSSIN